MVQNDKKLSITLHISRIIHYMIVIYGLLWGKRARNGHKWQKILCKKWSKMTKNCPSHFISQESHIIWLSFMGCYGEKGRKMVINDKNFCLLKMVQNDKKLCPSRFISQESFIIWLSFMGKKGENGHKWQKILSVLLHVSGVIRDMIVFYGTGTHF